MEFFSAGVVPAPNDARMARSTGEFVLLHHNERLDQDCGSYFIRAMYRRGSLRLKDEN